MTTVDTKNDLDKIRGWMGVVQAFPSPTKTVILSLCDEVDTLRDENEQLRDDLIRAVLFKLARSSA